MAHETTILISEAARKSWNLMISDISRFVRAREIEPLKQKIKQLTADNKYLQNSVFRGSDIANIWRKECQMRFALNAVYENEIRRLCRHLDKTDRAYYDLINDLDAEARKLLSSDEFAPALIQLDEALVGVEQQNNDAEFEDDKDGFVGEVV